MKRRILAIHFRKTIESSSLHDLANRVLSFSPVVGIRPPDLLYLDLSSTQRLFGGEEKIVSSLAAFFASAKIEAEMAVADDVATAGALSLNRTFFCAPGKSEEALAPLSLETLLFLINPLSPPSSDEIKSAREVISLLTLLGIRTLGGFARIPAATIGPRFGALGAELHRRVRGEAVLSLEPFVPTVTYREAQTFEEPIVGIEPVLFAAKHLLSNLERRLKKDFQAASELLLFLESENGEELQIRIPLLRPLRDEKAMLPLIREKLSHVSLTSPLISFALELALPVRDRGGQFHLFDLREQQSERLDELLGRLVAGIGPSFISAAALRARYRPEKSWEAVRFEPFEAKPRSSVVSMAQFQRPTVLLPSPEPLEIENAKEPFVLRSSNERFEVVGMEGPERLVGEWWDRAGHQRDYFRAETKSGQHLWLFKRLDQRKPSFFLHGYFD